MTEPYYLDEARERAERMSPGARLVTWLREAMLTPAEPIGDQEITEPPGEPPPRFPTGLESWQSKTGGGGYGCTCIAGFPKCGKSMLALSCAAEAALRGWRTLYFNAELSRYEMANRIRSYLGREPDQKLADCLSFHPCELGISIEHVFFKCAERLRLDDEYLLCISDSLQRIVSQSQTQHSDGWYWATMRKWIELWRMASKISGGRVASVVVSELAGAGHAKGRDIEFAADLVVKILPTDDAEYFELSIPYARSSRGGTLGRHWLDGEHGRFVPMAQEKSNARDWASDDYSDML